VIISTWSHGIAANLKAAETLRSGGTALDAVENGVRVSEADPEVQSVGYGGLPDRDGYVTLDACIMDSKGNAGSVAFLENIIHPISVARLVMEKTNHVMLVGDGAKEFALTNGFKEENLLTEKSKKAWEEWKAKTKTDAEKTKSPADTSKTHDTISMLVLDKDANLAGACTTSGLAYKMHGRVGDSPIIGAGMYCDNETGAAGATGKGEEVIKTCGSFLIVELMKQGRTPQEAVDEAVRRLVKKYNGKPDFQVAYVAIRKDGEIAAASVKPGFQYALYKNERNELIDVKSVLGYTINSFSRKQAV
jgi:isoaspartyl peptidase/L-asparaginase-like protein (Ntn-hydrolase superfamily)